MPLIRSNKVDIRVGIGTRCDTGTSGSTSSQSDCQGQEGWSEILTEIWVTESGLSFRPGLLAQTALDMNAGDKTE
ncbi:unnamed protein product [Ectocarpus sp. 12 AP-2014]